MSAAISGLTTGKSRDGAEKRYLPRWIVNNRVLYRKNESEFYRECVSKDISCDGACLLSDESLNPTQKLVLVVYLSEYFAVQVLAHVLWNQITEKEVIHGVQFENTSQKVQELILQHAFECKKDVLTKNWFEGWNKV